MTRKVTWLRADLARLNKQQQLTTAASLACLGRHTLRLTLGLTCMHSARGWQRNAFIRAGSYAHKCACKCVHMCVVVFVVGFIAFMAQALLVDLTWLALDLKWGNWLWLRKVFAILLCLLFCCVVVVLLFVFFILLCCFTVACCLPALLSCCHCNDDVADDLYAVVVVIVVCSCFLYKLLWRLHDLSWCFC